MGGKNSLLKDLNMGNLGSFKNYADEYLSKLQEAKQESSQEMNDSFN
jgi:hypothetical protein